MLERLFRTEWCLSISTSGTLVAMEKGHFIVIDGGDGAGKDTQIELLKAHYPDAVYVRDPGGTEMGMKVRDILQYKEGLAKRAELFLFLATRNQLVEEVIEPSLDACKVVISNRFDLSTLAYQVYGRERTDMLSMLRSMSEFARGECMPDLYIVLDVSAEVGMARSEARGARLTRFEKEKIAFHERVREGYLAHAKEYPNSVVIDANRGEADVAKDVQAAVKKFLEAHA